MPSTTNRASVAVVGAQRPRCHPNRQHLPAAPLLEAVTSCATRRQLSLEALLDQAARRAFYRARQSGELTLVAVEDFCDRLGLHPRELYGDAYDRAAFTYVACAARRHATARAGEQGQSGGAC